MGHKIEPGTVLPARRAKLRLSADRAPVELAVPLEGEPSAVVVCLNRAPAAGGSTDHHVFRTAALRLPALAGVGVLRANAQDADELGAAVEVAASLGVDHVWLAGWSFGADLALQHGARLPVAGAVLLSPSLRDVETEQLAAWAAAGPRLTVLVAELEDHLRPDEARQRFAAVRDAEVVALEWARHHWEGDTERVLDEIVRRVAPEVGVPLPREWTGDLEQQGNELPIPHPRREG